MDKFLEEINSIEIVDRLISLKEEIKMQIMEPQLHWETRMLLYKRVQYINTRIKQIQ